MGLRILVQLLLFNLINKDNSKRGGSTAVRARQSIQYTEEVTVDVELELGHNQDK